MNKRQKAVYKLLMKKPKVKAFGFNKKELKGLAAKIAENLTSEEDASDEDVNAEIEKEIEAVLPVLEFGRSYANRVINDSRNGDEDDNNDDDDDEDDDDETSTKSKSKSNKSSKSRKGKKSDEEPEWFKAFRDSMEKKFDELTGERVSDKRKAKLEKLLKDTGKFGERTLKSYARMRFENDEEFDEFFAEVEEDLKSENQERANKGLEKLGAPATGGSEKKDKKTEVLSDDEIKEVAKM